MWVCSCASTWPCNLENKWNQTERKTFKLKLHSSSFWFSSNFLHLGPLAAARKKAKSKKYKEFGGGNNVKRHNIKNNQSLSYICSPKTLQRRPWKHSFVLAASCVAPVSYCGWEKKTHKKKSHSLTGASTRTVVEASGCVFEEERRLLRSDIGLCQSSGTKSGGREGNNGRISSVQNCTWMCSTGVITQQDTHFGGKQHQIFFSHEKMKYKLLDFLFLHISPPPVSRTRSLLAAPDLVGLPLGESFF